MELFKNLFGKSEEVNEEKVSVQQSAVVEQEEDAEELIAVFAAAIAASMGADYQSNLIVKSFRRIPAISPVWNTVSRKELIERKL